MIAANGEANDYPQAVALVEDAWSSIAGAPGDLGGTANGSRW